MSSEISGHSSATSHIAEHTCLNQNLKHLIPVSSLIPWNPASIYVKQFWLARITLPHCWPKGYWIQQNCKNYACAQFILEGDMTVSCEGRVLTVGAGDGVIIPPGNSILSTGPSGHLCKQYIIPAGNLFRQHISDLHFSHLELLPGVLTPEFLSIYRHICHLHERKDPRTIPHLAGLSYQLLIMTAASLENRNYPPLFSQILDFLKADLAGSASLEDISKAVGISCTGIKNLFRKHLNTTPGKYILKLRMDTARKLLDQRCYLIKEVARNCGFSNQLYFSNVFRKYFGLSPRNYLQGGMPGSSPSSPSQEQIRQPADHDGFSR